MTSNHLKTLAASALLAASLSAGAALAQGQDKAGEKITVVHAGHLLAVPGKDMRGASSILIKDGRIVEIRDGYAAIDGARVIDLKDKTVLPGLIDSHVHLSGDPEGAYWQSVVKPEAYAAVIGVKNAAITLKAGFTTVRDVGSPGQVMFAVRDAVKEGKIMGPRILASGPALSIVGGHADTNGFNQEVSEKVFPPERTGACTGAVECAERVRQFSKYGADVIKFTATGGVLSQQGRGLDQHFTDAEMKAIIDTAHRLGLKVAAHAHGVGGIKGAVEAGVDSIEHGTYIDEADAKLMKKTGAYMVPTLMAFQGIREGLGQHRYTPVVENKVREVLKVVGQGLKLAIKNGVHVAFGTDAGVFEHGRNGGEFALMVKYGGMSPADAIAAATVSAAKLLGVDSDVGALESGKYADLVAVDGDPLEDVSVLEDVKFVMKNGDVIPLD